MTDAAAILRFWRDIEVLNIPAAPKIRNAKDASGRSEQRFLFLEEDTKLPWESGHKGYLESREGHEWRHVVYLGVADMKKLAGMVISQTCPNAKLTERDRRQLSGDGYLGLFAVNGQGRIDAESYVPASFMIGLAEHQENGHLFDIKDALKKAEEKFKERRKGQIAASPTDAQAVEEGSAGTSRQDIEAELAALLNPVLAMAEGIEFKVVIKSSRGKKDVDLLNSFYMDDLDNLITEASAGRTLGAALSAYLGAPSTASERKDILVQHDAMARAVSAADLPLGRWPSRKAHHLLLAQQAAVNQICALNKTGGLIAVNGPPGTGKTTLLRDVIADVVVRRAQSLAALSNSWGAFENKAEIGGMDFYRLKPGIATGTGIVVSSNNNAAVENITKELPSLGSIATEEYPAAGYLQDVAKQVGVAAGIPGEVWGMVAAALGNRDNRRKFIDAFYPYQSAVEYSQGTPCDMRALLKAQDKAEKGVTEASWQTAKREFMELLGQAEKLKEGFARYEMLSVQSADTEAGIAESRKILLSLPDKLAAARDRQAKVIRDAERQFADGATELREVQSKEQSARLKLDSALNLLRIAEQDAKPSVLEGMLSWIGAQSDATQENAAIVRRERIRCAQLQEELSRLISDRCDASNHAEHCERRRATVQVESDAEIESLNAEGAANQARIDAAERKLQQIAAEIDGLRQRGYIVPDSSFFARSAEARHLSSVWVTEAFDELRGKLFLAALKLHEATLFANHWKAMKSLAVVRVMLSQSTPHPLTEAERRMVWDMLFFVVPVVSTTLASFDRLFAGMDRESIGWLLIDEAGQATPQSVAGALWRSQKAVIIGDPFQVEPVMTVPSAVIAELANRYGLGAEWSPSVQSAQTLADRVMKLGAYVGEGPDAVWTGLPLRAHRRCIDPMFSVANAIAYEGQMVQANASPANIMSPLGNSAWFDVKGTAAEAQVVKEEIDVLARILTRLKSTWPTMNDGTPAKVYVISPFKEVADAARNAISRADMWRGFPIDAGTVHTFQGKEAEVVILMLGSQPGQAGSGSRAWASQKPNLLNVALTRAKLRLYVVGNSEDWGACPQFNVLVEEFRKTGSIKPIG